MTGPGRVVGGARVTANVVRVDPCENMILEEPRTFGEALSGPMRMRLPADNDSFVACLLAFGELGAYLEQGLTEGALLARQARDRLQPILDQGLAEGAVLAEQAALQARRVGRAVKADPVPAIVGAVGLVLLVRLLSRRRSRLD